MDSAAYQTLQRLIEAGVLSANTDNVKTLYCAPTPDTPQEDDGRAKRLAEAQEQLTKSKHKQPAYPWVNTPPAKASGFGLRLKAGLIGHSAD